jgi:hypothetical protein
MREKKNNKNKKKQNSTLPVDPKNELVKNERKDHLNCKRSFHQRLFPGREHRVGKKKKKGCV